MRKFTIQLLNYRCFSGNSPTKWTFQGDALTSFVGPNNTGKSSFLRLFYELRMLFNNIADEQNLRNHVLNPNLGMSFLGTSDNTAEIAAHRSTGPVSIELSIEVEDPRQVSRVRLEMRDRKTLAWSTQIWRGPTFSEVLLDPNAYPPSIEVSGTHGPLLTTELRSFLRGLGQEVTYIPAYRNLINQGSADYYDIVVGQGFINKWDQWQGGDSKANREAIIEVVSDIKNIFGFKELTVTATPANDTLTLVVDGRSERIRELGAGLSQFVIVLGNVATKRPELLVIDEPELNLHPAMQLKFLAAMAKYAKHVIFATHSLGLARTAEHVYSVKRAEGKSVIAPLPGTRSYAELLGEMSFEAYREIGFDQLLCVEGVTDILFMQVFLRRLGLDHRIVVFPLAGDTLIAASREQELAELKRISDKVAVLIDSEMSAEGAELTANRRALVKTCEKLGFNAHVTSRRATENYLSDAAVKEEKGAAYRALAPYEDFKDLTPCWAKGENWKIAQHMTKGDIMATDVGEWLATL